MNLALTEEQIGRPSLSNGGSRDKVGWWARSARKHAIGAPDATSFCAMIERIMSEPRRRVADQRHRLLPSHGYLVHCGIDNIMRLWQENQIPEGRREITRPFADPSPSVGRG